MNFLLVKIAKEMDRVPFRKNTFNFPNLYFLEMCEFFYVEKANINVDKMFHYALHTGPPL